MHVKEQPCVRSECGDDGCAEGNVWNKVSVHDVQVQPIGSCILDCPDLTPELGKVCSKQGGRDFDRLIHDVISLCLSPVVSAGARYAYNADGARKSCRNSIHPQCRSEACKAQDGGTHGRPGRISDTPRQRSCALSGIFDFCLILYPFFPGLSSLCLKFQRPYILRNEILFFISSQNGHKFAV